MARFDKLELSPDDGIPPEWRVSKREPPEWLIEADRLKRVGEYDPALQAYSRALEGDKSLIVGWVGQCQMLIELGEYKEAELWSQKALELFTNNGDLLAAQAQAACRDGDVERAVMICDGAIKQRGWSEYRWRVRGETMLCGGRDPSKHCFDKAIQIDPKDWLIPLEIARVYLHHNQPTPALGRARQATDKGADEPYAWYVFGRCQFKLGMMPHAALSFHRCQALQPNFQDINELMVAVAKTSNGGSPFKQFWKRLFG